MMLKEESDRKKAIEVMKSSAIAAGASAFFLMTAVAPMERIKLLLQNQDASTQIGSSKKYKSTADCFRRIVKEQGFLSLWRGYYISVIRYFPSKLLGFTIFNHFKSYSDKSFLGHLIVGALAGCATTTVFHPLTFLRTRIGVDIGTNKGDRQFNSLYDCVRKIVENDGIRGIYRGLVMSLFLTSMSKSMYFGLFESGKIHFDRFEDKSHHLPLLWLFASCTTALGYILCYPFDTLRRRMMMQAGRRDVIYASYIDCFHKIYKKEGLRGFFKGVTPQLMKSFGTSVFLVVNDRVQKLCK